MVWRLVVSKVATLEEIDRDWSLDDVLDGNALLDYQAAAREIATK